MLGLLLAGLLTAGGYDGGSALCTLRDPEIAESSGLVTSSAYDDLMFTHNDSGDVARFFEIDRTCRTRATFVLPGVQARDWEDISRGPGRTLWLGDIGDNSDKRDNGLLVHRVAEPGPASGTVRLRATSYRLRYEDGPRNAEALLVHPRTGQLLIVTKSPAGGGVYEAPLPLRTDRPNTLHRVGSVNIPLVTGGDISPDGARVVLRNYTTAYEWDVQGDDVVAALRRQPVRIALPTQRQGEGISYRRDGRALLLSSEGAGTAIEELVLRPRAGASKRSASHGASRRLPVAVTALGLAVGALLVVVLLRRRRSPKSGRV